MRIGIVGCGAIACHCHIPALKRISGVTLVAGADPVKESLERARRLIPMATHLRAEDLLQRDDIDAVVISVPTHMHAEVAVMAAVAGKHFYLEKPIAADAAEASRIIEAAARSGVTSAVGFNRRLHPLYEKARELLATRRLGTVRAVQTVFSEPVSVDGIPEWKKRRATGGGVLLDLASHHVDLVRWLLGDEIARVSASLASESSDDDSASVHLVMRSGVEVQSFFSFRAGYADFVELICERGTLRVDRHAAHLTMHAPRRMGYGSRRAWVVPDPANLNWRMRRLVRPAEDPSYHRALTAFVRQIEGGAARSASLADGMRSLEVVLAAEESVRTGRPVSLAAS